LQRSLPTLTSGSCLLTLVAVFAASAQDRRHIIEPRIPQVCTSVTAELFAPGGRLSEADEQKLDTARLQNALDQCPKGRAVELVAGGTSNAFLSGPISVPAGITLLLDRGVTLFASRDPKLYERTPGSCGVVNAEAPGCKPLISVHNAPHAAVMGDGAIDGRGYAQLLHGEVTWWQLAEQARAGGRQQVPRLVVVDGSDDFTLYRITLKNSPNFHVTFSNGQGFTVWGVRIDTPRNARNTDGIDPGGSASDITVTRTFISTGDDNVAIKGSGTGVQHMSVLDNHFYAGHGLSIGSETFGGVSDIVVRNLTLEGTDNGLRIKSNIHRGGLVEHVLYEDVCVRNNKVPITFDTRYDNPGPDTKLIPEFRSITLRRVRVSGGGKITVDGHDLEHSTQVNFDGVTLEDPSDYSLFADNAQITYGPQPVNFELTGNNVRSFRAAALKREATPPTEADCASRFVPFPKGY
jgi:polygalacturonase